jgi:hypothetical protein
MLPKLITERIPAALLTVFDVAVTGVADPSLAAAGFALIGCWASWHRLGLGRLRLQLGGR